MSNLTKQMVSRRGNDGRTETFGPMSQEKAMAFARRSVEEGFYIERWTVRVASSYSANLRAVASCSVPSVRLANIKHSACRFQPRAR